MGRRFSSLVAAGYTAWLFTREPADIEVAGQLAAHLVNSCWRERSR